MKKHISIVLSLFIIIGLTSCSQRKAQPKEEKGQKQEQQDSENGEKPDKKEGERLLNEYARALVLRDSKVKMFYSEGLKQSTGSLTPSPNPHPNGYKVGSVGEKEGKLEARLTIFSVYTGEPYFASDESGVTIIKEKGSYVIDKIEKSKSTEVNEKDKTLFMKEDGDIKGKDIVKLDELPRFATPQGASPDQKFNIGRDKFGPVAMDPDSKKLAVTVMGENSALMIMDIEKKHADPVDLFFDGTPDSIAWSQDGKFMAVEMSNKDESKFVYVYDVEKAKRVDDPMKEALRRDKYTISNPYWISENELVFNVSGISQLSPDDQKKTGSYKFDVKNVSLTKF